MYADRAKAKAHVITDKDALRYWALAWLFSSGMVRNMASISYCGLQVGGKAFRLFLSCNTRIGLVDPGSIRKRFMVTILCVW